MAIKNAKADFITENLREHEGNPKKFWQSIHQVIPGKKSKFKECINLKDQNDKSFQNNEEAANYMNDFFTNIGPSLAKKFDKPWVYTGLDYMSELHEIETNTDELLQYIRAINITKSSAIDYLSSRILKDAFTCLIDQFTHLVNASLSQGTFPSDWKNAIVIPLPKEGDLSRPNNYRPISLLPLPGKIIEKVVHKRLLDYLESNHILVQNQGGFRRNNSTINSVAIFTHEVYSAINNKEIAMATYIDFQKAFDTVDHKILVNKLEIIGVRDHTLRWLSDYLTNRKQCTQVNGCYSKSNFITCGVPQGSILGPLLFLIYVNDIVHESRHTAIYLYADDTVLLSKSKSIANARTDMQNDLNSIMLWCERNKLSLNVKKTKNMLFGTRHRLKNTRCGKISINNTDLEIVNQYKYLGIILDSHLSYAKHLNNVVRMVSHKINLLGRVRQYLNYNASILVYKTMILPYFDYGDILFMNTNQALLSKLQKLQNRALKICLQPNAFVTLEYLHRETKVALLYKRREAHLLNYMYKKRDVPALLDTKPIHTRARDGPLFKVAKPNCEKFKQSVLYNGAVSWNTLPPVTRNIDSYITFRNTQKNVILVID